MILSRRNFLGGVLALAGAAAITQRIPLMHRPTLWGDGIHDDAPALNALFNNEPINILADRVLIRHHEQDSILMGGRFAIGSTIKIADKSKLLIADCEFIAKMQNPIFAVENCKDFNMQNNFWRFTDG